MSHKRNRFPTKINNYTLLIIKFCFTFLRKLTRGSGSLINIPESDNCHKVQTPTMRTWTVIIFVIKSHPPAGLLSYIHTHPGPPTAPPVLYKWQICISCPEKNYNRWLLVAASHPYNLKAQLSNSGIRRLWGS